MNELTGKMECGAGRPMMEWSRLISDKRFGMEDYHDRRGGSRSDFQRDFDRLVFSSPFRRLQNKTQVFPLPGSVFVHNRLTHSMEVACVGRSMAIWAIRRSAIRARRLYRHFFQRGPEPTSAMNLLRRNGPIWCISRGMPMPSDC